MNSHQGSVFLYAGIYPRPRILQLSRKSIVSLVASSGVSRTGEDRFEHCSGTRRRPFPLSNRFGRPSSQSMCSGLTSALRPQISIPGIVNPAPATIQPYFHSHEHPYILPAAPAVASHGTRHAQPASRHQPAQLLSPTLSFPLALPLQLKH